MLILPCQGLGGGQDAHLAGASGWRAGAGAVCEQGNRRQQRSVMIWAQPGGGRKMDDTRAAATENPKSRLRHRNSGPTLPAGRAAPAPAFWMPPRALRAPCFCSTACALCCCCCWSTLPFAPGFCCCCFWPTLLPPFADWAGAFLPAACCPPAFLAPAAPAAGFFLAFLIRSSRDRSSRGLLAMLAAVLLLLLCCRAREGGQPTETITQETNWLV